MSLDNLTPMSMDENSSSVITAVTPGSVSSSTTPRTLIPHAEFHDFQNNNTNSAGSTSISSTTSQADHQSNTTTKKKRSQYSRNGCKECKRRKLKCDETKPSCWQCTRLGKSCIYLDKAKEKQAREAAKAAAALKSQLEKSVVEEKPDFQVKFAKPITISREIPFDYNEDKERLSGVKRVKRSANDVPDLFNFSGIDTEFKNFFDDETLLNDLNSLASEILEDISISPSSSINSFTQSEISIQDSLDLIPLDSDFSAISASKPKPWEQVNIPEIFSQFTALPLTHQADLKLFLVKIASFLFPFNQDLMITILTKHATHCKYLLYAMLSLSSQHPGYKKQYLAICFKSMKDTFEKSDHDNQTEPLILAILLLATDSTSKDWKFHLRGAKDILLKVIRNERLVLTPGLLLAKSWFIAIEILARLEGVGITTSETELDELLNYDKANQNATMMNFDQHKAAIDMGLLLRNDYDLFLGYSKELLDFYKFQFHLQSLAQSDPSFHINNTQLLQLIKHAMKSQECQIISKEVVIPQLSPHHPSNPLIPSEKYRDSALGSNHQTNVFFSWYDLAHQLHALSLTIKSYLEFLPYVAESPLIQDILSQMFGMCHFYTISQNLPPQPTEIDLQSFITIPKDEDARLLLLQGPMVQMGLISYDEVQRFKVRMYFNTLIRFGVPSALGSLKKLEAVWDGNPDRRGSGDSAVPFA